MRILYTVPSDICVPSVSLSFPDTRPTWTHGFEFQSMLGTSGKDPYFCSDRAAVSRKEFPEVVEQGIFPQVVTVNGVNDRHNVALRFWPQLDETLLIFLIGVTARRRGIALACS